MRKFGASGVMLIIIPGREANALVSLISGNQSNSGTSWVKFMGSRQSPHRAFVRGESPPYLSKLLTDYSSQDIDLPSLLCILFSPFPMWGVLMRSHLVMSSQEEGRPGALYEWEVWERSYLMLLVQNWKCRIIWILREDTRAVVDRKINVSLFAEFLV